MRKKDLNYVSLDSKTFLTDESFQVMSMEERGLYCTLIFNLYANGGSAVPSLNYYQDYAVAIRSTNLRKSGKTYDTNFSKSVQNYSIKRSAESFPAHLNCRKSEVKRELRE